MPAWLWLPTHGIIQPEEHGSPVVLETDWYPDENHSATSETRIAFDTRPRPAQKNPCSSFLNMSLFSPNIKKRGVYHVRKRSFGAVCQSEPRESCCLKQQNATLWNCPKLSGPWNPSPDHLYRCRQIALHALPFQTEERAVSKYLWQH